MKTNTATKLFRLSNKLYKIGIPLVPGLIRRYMRVIYSCEIPYVLEMGAGSYFSHSGLGVVIVQSAVIGKNVKIMQNVTVGGRNGTGSPIIGDNVFIGAGASILGGVRVGNGAVIGSNAVVIQDVPDNAIAVGVPAVIKQKKNKDKSYLE
ncbi:MAG: serine acetyltransferase [Youngiibacter sp.]|nr:serine acetyltransferase [Youngiibacter sp.]